MFVSVNIVRGRDFSMFPKLTDERIEQLVIEYEKYSEDKHALPFVVWLKYKKKFPTIVINQIREKAYD